MNQKKDRIKDQFFKIWENYLWSKIMSNLIFQDLQDFKKFSICDFLKFNIFDIYRFIQIKIYKISIDKEIIIWNKLKIDFLIFKDKYLRSKILQNFI